jgi:GAF domain-containing protein
MEPTPETRQALGEFVSLEDPDLEQLLEDLGRAAREIVPELTGLSLAITKEQLTFTLAATDSEIAALDATQYLDGGPCVDVGEDEEEDIHHFSVIDPLDEGRWQLFAAASAAHGVASTLSLPVYANGELVGSVNLYAGTPDAFAGRVEDLASLVGAQSTQAITNADLSFSTRIEAAAAPQRLRDRAVIETAIGLIAADKEIDIEEAHQQLLDAAARAGVLLTQVARVVISVFKSQR